MLENYSKKNTVNNCILELKKELEDCSTRIKNRSGKTREMEDKEKKNYCERTYFSSLKFPIPLIHRKTFRAT